MIKYEAKEQEYWRDVGTPAMNYIHIAHPLIPKEGKTNKQINQTIKKMEKRLLIPEFSQLYYYKVYTRQ